MERQESTVFKLKPFYESPILTIRVNSPWLNHVPQATFLSSVELGIKFQHKFFMENHHSNLVIDNSSSSFFAVPENHHSNFCSYISHCFGHAIALVFFVSGLHCFSILSSRSIRCSWLIVFFMSSISIFHLIILFIIKHGTLKSS